MAQETTKPPAKATETPADDVEKFLNEQKALETHRQDLIKELLREKEASIKAFDEKLAKLGYDGARPRRSHHKSAEDKKA